MNAAEAFAIGLVDHVAPVERLDQAAANYARLLLANSPESIAPAKAIVDRTQPAEALERRFAESFASPDFREGYAAFIAKRPPRFG